MLFKILKFLNDKKAFANDLLSIDWLRKLSNEDFLEIWDRFLGCSYDTKMMDKLTCARVVILSKVKN